MINIFIDDIAKKLLHKISVTKKYKSCIGEIDNNLSTEEIIQHIFITLYGRLWNVNEEKIKAAWAIKMGEDIDKESMATDYVGMGQVSEDKKSEIFRIIRTLSPFTAINYGFQNNISEELKLFLLVDGFNTVAHSLIPLFGDAAGKKFWFDLKNSVLVELISRIKKENIYINEESKHDNRVAIYFKIKAEGETKFFVWHSSADIIDKIPGYGRDEYSSEQIVEEIKKLLPSEKKNNLRYVDLDEILQTTNYEIYNSIFRQYHEFGKDISEIFEVDLREETKTLVYEGGGSYAEVEKDSTNESVLNNIDEKSAEMFVKLGKALSKDDIEDIFKQFGLENSNFELLKLRGRYHIFYLKLNLDGKDIILKCAEGFKYEKYVGKCYSKDQIAQMGQIYEPPKDVEGKVEIIESEMKQDNFIEEKKIAKSLAEEMGIDFILISEELREIDEFTKKSDFSQIIDAPNISDDIKEAFKILSLDTQSEEDKLSRAVGLMQAIEKLKNSDFEIDSSLCEVGRSVLEVIVKEKPNSVKIIKKRVAQEYYVQIELEETNKVLLACDSSYRDEKGIKLKIFGLEECISIPLDVCKEYIAIMPNKLEELKQNNAKEMFKIDEQEIISETISLDSDIVEENALEVDDTESVDIMGESLEIDTKEKVDIVGEILEFDTEEIVDIIDENLEVDTKENDDAKRITAKDVDTYVSEAVMNEYLGLIKLMTSEQKAMIVENLLASSSELEIGEIVKKLFMGKATKDRRNGGQEHE